MKLGKMFKSSDKKEVPSIAKAVPQVEAKVIKYYDEDDSSKEESKENIPEVKEEVVPEKTQETAESSNTEMSLEDIIINMAERISNLEQAFTKIISSLNLKENDEKSD